VTRLERAIAQQTEQWQDRIVTLPHLSLADYMRLCAAADVMLDTFPFGGGTSHYEALASHTPVVTLRTRQMRGRITAALYDRMKLGSHAHGTVARSVSEYVGMAITLGLDADANAAMRAKIGRNVEVLYDDMRGVEELGEWLANVSRPAYRA
jgi:protein O-GlcNAc transferase